MSDRRNTETLALAGADASEEELCPALFSFLGSPTSSTFWDFDGYTGAPLCSTSARQERFLGRRDRKEAAAEEEEGQDSPLGLG